MAEIWYNYFKAYFKRVDMADGSSEANNPGDYTYSIRVRI